jgi:ribonuclease H / adenosylcobalamin/alpha-ribazole phosphatase
VPPLYLLRHGAHGDVGQRLTGREPDGGLTDLGRKQALQALEELRATPPVAIHASPRRRTQETAAVIGQGLSIPVSTAEALDEIDFGEWSGRSFAELDADPRWHAWNARRGSARCPGGESMGEAQARALAFAFELSARHDGPVLLVTHCDIIRALHCWAERRPLDDIHSIDCPPGSLSRLDPGSDQKAAA